MLTLEVLDDEKNFWFVTIFFLWQLILTNLHKLLHHKRICDGHITYTCVLWLCHKICLWFEVTSCLTLVQIENCWIHFLPLYYDFNISFLGHSALFLNIRHHTTKACRPYLSEFDECRQVRMRWCLPTFHVRKREDMSIHQCIQVISIWFVRHGTLFTLKLNFLSLLCPTIDPNFCYSIKYCPENGLQWKMLETNRMQMSLDLARSRLNC